MKIRRLKLVNFANIYAGMSLKKLDIDFTKCKNDIVLIVGKNGSGKSSILSTLHPFPYIERDTNNLILEGEDGFKLFEFEDDFGNIYRAEHHFKLVSGKRKTSSFLKKNGIEMNHSGLVSTFNDVVNYEFNIDPNFLKLIRLGPNLTDIVSMTASERKDFIGFLLAEDVYTNCFKIAAEKSKEIKRELAVVASYDNIKNADNLEYELREAKLNLDRCVAKLEEATKAYDYNESVMKAGLIFSSEEIEKIKEDKEKFDEYLEEESYHIKTIGKSMYDIKKICEKIKSVSDNMVTNNTKLIEYKSSKMLFDKQLSELNNQLIDLDNKYKLDSSYDYDFYNNLAIKTKKDISKITKSLSDIEVIPNTNEVESAMNIFEEIKISFKTLTEYPAKFVSIIRKKAMGAKIENIPKILDKYAVNKLKDISKKMSLAEALENDNDVMILSIPQGCKHYKNCEFFKAITQNSNSVNDTEGMDDEFDTMMKLKDFAAMLEGIFALLNRYSSFKLAKLNRDKFILFIVENGFSYKLIDDEADHLESLYNYAKENDRVKDLEKTYNDLKDELANYKIAKEEVSKEKTSIYAQIGEIQTKCNDITQRISDLEQIIEKDEECKEMYEDVKYFIQHMKPFLESNKESIEQRYKKALEDEKTNDKYEDMQYELLETKMDASNEVDKCRRIISDIEYNIRKRDDLNARRDILKEQYESIELIRESLSPIKGIPLIFIQLYLKNIQIMANNIIRQMFNNEITISNFIITEKEFSIPYSVNGVEVRDLSYASQGQKMIIIIALSFAILQQYISKYNIVLLDEMDGPLYKDNKEKFIRIVEEQMKNIGCKQCVMITHNQLFENYPVDLIFTSEVRNNDYNKSNVIWSV